MGIITRVVSSLTKVFPDEVMGREIHNASALKNEPFSFQIAYKKDSEWPNGISFYTKIETELELSDISVYKVGYVNVLNPYSNRSDKHFDRKTVGLYPDVLYKRNTENEIRNDGFWEPNYFEINEDYTLTAMPCYNSLWFTVNENGRELKAGDYKIKVTFFASADQSEICSSEIYLKIIDKCLLPQDVHNTSWFYPDCLADVYGLEMWCDRHFEIIEAFITEAVKHGQNMIYIPAFTPPLDTPVGQERKTTQLVGVEVINGEYIFDFSLLRRYIEICKRAGATHLEHSHLFTQWGARFAPKIMATVNGEYKRIFGWETDSKSPEYAAFLKAYLRELKILLNEIGYGKNILFHISDEPMKEHIEYYKNAKSVIQSELQGYMYGDALSHYAYYEDGTVDVPIVILESNDMEKFIENCDNLWVYNTAAHVFNGLSNRLISTTGARNRILGTQMYCTNTKGYLNWAYNFYYGTLCHGMQTPLQSSGNGTSYIVYPHTDGTPLLSLRMKVFNEGIIDNRALKTLEAMVGRERVISICEKHFGKVSYNTCPTNDELLAFREDINNEIAANL
ncbi:MAG: DUF4091 domain-containing protein [Clostridia bacterium]|nr:DUF4091 domain-containing protein [Clostridia bacterium]